MTIGYADIPKPIRSGLVVVDPLLGTPQKVIVMQFNPDTLQRSLVPPAVGQGGPDGGAAADRSGGGDVEVRRRDRRHRPARRGGAQWCAPAAGHVEMLI